MNSLHKKRQAFRQAIRSKSIQELFYRKRHQLLEELRQNVNKDQSSIQAGKHSYQIIQPTSLHCQIFSQKESLRDLKKSLADFNQQISCKDQQHIFLTITDNHQFQGLQRLYLISTLINRKEFCLNSEVQGNYGWKRIIEEFLNTINEQGNQKRDSKNKNQNHQNFQSKIEISFLKNILCFSLIKIWQIKPKTDYFLLFTKSYNSIFEKLSHTLSLTLIAQLSYEKILLPNYQFINRVLQLNVDQLSEVKFFRILQILKNFVFHFRVENSQIHSRQLIFEYLTWIKIQINLLLSEHERSINQNLICKEAFHSGISPPIGIQAQFETRYFLIYLLFTVLNKFSEINDKEKEHLDTKQILILNEELLNHSQNHTTMKFLIEEGKKAYDPHHKKNIYRTLTFFISFLEISTWGKNNQQDSFGAQLEEIEKTFQGTELDWFESFN